MRRTFLLEPGPLPDSHWTLLGLPRRVRRSSACPCRCVCGKKRWVLVSTLRDGTSRSCGCRRGTGGKCLPPQLLTHNGETLPLSEWARRTGLHKEVIRQRLRLGWPPAEALAVPVRGRRVAELPAPAPGCETPSP